MQGTLDRGQATCRSRDKSLTQCEGMGELLLSSASKPLTPVTAFNVQSTGADQNNVYLLYEDGLHVLRTFSRPAAWMTAKIRS